MSDSIKTTREEAKKAKKAGKPRAAGKAKKPKGTQKTLDAFVRPRTADEDVSGNAPSSKHPLERTKRNKFQSEEFRSLSKGCHEEEVS